VIIVVKHVADPSIINVNRATQAFLEMIIQQFHICAPAKMGISTMGFRFVLFAIHLAQHVRVMLPFV